MGLVFVTFGVPAVEVPDMVFLRDTHVEHDLSYSTDALVEYGKGTNICSPIEIVRTTDCCKISVCAGVEYSDRSKIRSLILPKVKYD